MIDKDQLCTSSVFRRGLSGIGGSLLILFLYLRKAIIAKYRANTANKTTKAIHVASATGT